uniref:Uncharacterized protein n=5 Tax=Enterobacteriaceae TaxID=543 RepID=L7SVI2_CITFR|nr:hypothetical protein [Citrobacter freundii]AKS10480.1 hypothetical protein [Klebsiella pneumoniae]
MISGVPCGPGFRATHRARQAVSPLRASIPNASGLRPPRFAWLFQPVPTPGREDNRREANCPPQLPVPLDGLPFLHYRYSTLARCGVNSSLRRFALLTPPLAPVLHTGCRKRQTLQLPYRCFMAEILQLLPPVILAIAALITAITGLIKVLKSKKK